MNKIIKQHDNANYSKEQNDVEKYIMKIIQRYFLVEQEYSENQIESIIVEAIRRIKIYLADHQAGIFAVNHKTGDVHLDITDLDGEPFFEKNTAFNKDFGDEEDTICAGNDYRLSNPREPLPHTHYVDEVPGLEDLLYDRYGLIFVSHIHRDFDAIDKIIYTGTQPEIDLVLIEQFIEMVIMFITQVKNIEITAENTKKDFSDFIDSIQARVDNVNEIYQKFLNEQPWVKNIKEYIDNKHKSFINSYSEKLKTYITKSRIQSISAELGLPIYDTGYFNFNPIEEVSFCELDKVETDKFNISAAVYDDETGLPIENVEVKLDNNTTKSTDSSGSYSFADVPKGEHTITFKKDKYYDDKLYTFITSSHTDIENVYMRIVTFTLDVNVFYSVADVIVIVKDSETSAAIANATILLSDLTATTDSNGQYTFHNMDINRTYQIIVSCPSYISKTEHIEVNTDTSVTKTILLEAIVRTLTVIIQDKNNNSYIENCNVEIKTLENVKRTASSNANGIAYFQCRINKTYFISANKNGYKSVTNQEIAFGDSDETVTLKLETYITTLNLTVKNTEDDVMSEVTFTLKNVTDNTTEEISDITDNNGVYVFTLIGGKNYNITAHKEYYKDKSITLTASQNKDETVNKEIVMEHDIKQLNINVYESVSSAYGYVKNTRTNEGISGATVSISMQGTSSVTTDSNGKFTFNEVKTGIYTFTAVHDDYETSNNTLRNITVLGTEDKEVGTIMLTPLLANNTYEFHDEWTRNGKDLDMYLIGMINGTLTNVYYSNKNENDVHLDVDAQGSTNSGFAENGTFTFSTANDYMDIYIKDYNNRDSQTTDMQDSGLSYTLKMGKNTLGSYARPANGIVMSTNAPSNPSGIGPWLHVCRITPNGFTAINTYKTSI